MSPPSSRPLPGQGHSQQPTVANDVVPAAITFAALGLDISQAEVMACLLLPDGSEVVPRWTIPNSQPGAQALAERVQALAKAQGIKELRIGLEATGLYWWHLACFLKETPILTEVNQTIYVFNPALVQGPEAVSMPTRVRPIVWMPFSSLSGCGSGVCPRPFSPIWSMPPCNG
jgi:Transposase